MSTDKMDEEKNTRAELARKKYLYRSLIVKGGARVVNRRSVRQLIGPDCAYHLYSYMKKDSSDDSSEDAAHDYGENGHLTPDFELS